MDTKTYNQGGYAKHSLSKEYIKEVHSRTADSKGKMHRGESGRSLLKRKLSQQAYFERNK